MRHIFHENLHQTREDEAKTCITIIEGQRLWTSDEISASQKRPKKAPTPPSVKCEVCSQIAPPVNQEVDSAHAKYTKYRDFGLPEAQTWEK